MTECDRCGKPETAIDRITETEVGEICIVCLDKLEEENVL